MYAKTFKINGVDLSAHVHEDGPQFTSVPVFGLPDKMTADGVTHVDFVKYKDVISVPFNPTTPEAARTISNLYKSGVLWLTTYNPDLDADVTIRTKPATISRNPALTAAGIVTHYQIINLPFEEL